MDYIGVNFVLKISICLLSTIVQAFGYHPIVHTDKGTIRGTRIHLHHGHEVDIYYGIPFAKPPIGEYRFRNPQPNDPWEGIYNATRKPNACMQGYEQMFPNFTGALVWNPNTEPNEDCLYLNVWAPRTNPPYENKAVLVWIFGGGFYSGSSVLDIYDGKYLAAENDVVVVSMQYRVGSMGFICFGTTEAPGNAGMLDQDMALDWIQRNIHLFGGNPHNVTLFGESAGAASVGLHLVSPISRGKFHRAILQSGAPHAYWATVTKEEGIRRSIAFAKKMKCDFDDTEQIINCLRSKNAVKFPEMEFDPDVVMGISQFPFVPVIDGFFLQETPEMSLKRGSFKKVPILLGNNINEGSWFTIYSDPIHFNLNSQSYVSRSQFRLIIDSFFRFYPQYPSVINTFGKEAILFHYTPWKDPLNQEMNRDKIESAVADLNFICPVVDLAEQYSMAGQKVYYYVFSQRSSVNPWPTWMGVLHADEINFVFGEPLDNAKNYSHREKKLSKKIMKYWTNYAKTGNPNREPGELSLNEWPVHTHTERKYLELNTKYLHAAEMPNAIGVGPRIQECAFWRHYLPSLVDATADISEMEREWKIQFSEWRNKYIVDWKIQFDNFLKNYELRMQTCGGQ